MADNEATRFIDSIGTNSFYQVVARPTAWDGNAPPISKPLSEYVWDNQVIAAKKINEVDASVMIPRVDWQEGTVYSQYDPSDLSKSIHVLTDRMDVYKVIENNSGSPSTSKPTSTIREIFRTSDGYKWKWMYTLDENDVLDFLTDTYMPVKNVQNNNSNENISEGTLPQPTGGHGSDNIEELNAGRNIVCISVSERGNPDFSSSEEFRLSAIGYDLKTSDGQAATEIIKRQTVKIDLEEETDFVVGDRVTDGTEEGIVIKVKLNVLYVIMETSGVFDAQKDLVGVNRNLKESINTIDEPELQTGSGTFIQVKNFVPVKRSPEQTERFRTIIEL